MIYSNSCRKEIIDGLPTAPSSQITNTIINFCYCFIKSLQ